MIYRNGTFVLVSIVRYDNVGYCVYDQWYVQDGSGYLERKELDNFLVDLIVSQYGVRIASHFVFYTTFVAL